MAAEGDDGRIVKVVVLDKRNGGFGGFDGFALVDDFSVDSALMLNFHVFADDGIGAEVENQADNET